MAIARLFGKFKAFGLRLIYSPHMLWGIALASFLEAIIVPIPLEAILIPLMQARRERMFIISTVVLVAFMAGACVGYGVGYFLFDTLSDKLIPLISTPEQFEQVRQQMHAKGFWFVFSVGVTPVPFQIAMLTAGALQYPLLMFLLASGLSRSIRYYGLALLVWVAGNQAQKLFEYHRVAASVGITLVVVAVWWVFL